MIEKKFKVIKKKKEVLSITISPENRKMIQELMDGYDEPISLTVDSILEYFKDEIYDKGKIPKNKEEEKNWTWN